MTAAQSAVEARRIHPLVRLACRLRRASFPMTALMLGSLLWERRAGAPLWAAPSSDALLSGALADLDAFATGAEQADDITLLAVGRAATD